MATLRIQQADAIVFQLIRKDQKAGTDWQEVAVFAMAVKPTTLRYEYGSRSVIAQTVPDQGFVDRFGSKLTRVSMTGTFGLQPRRQGIEIQDGYTRLLNFRDDVFKRLQQARPEKQDGESKYVYSLNYYDFIYDERFAVNLETFIPEVSARRNPYEPTYTLTFTSIGPVQTVDTKDGMLSMLLNFSFMLTKAQDGLTGAVATLKGIPAIGAILQGAGAYVTAIDTLSNLAGSLAGLASMYGSALAGQTTMAAGTISSKVNSFIGDLKG